MARHPWLKRGALFVAAVACGATAVQAAGYYYVPRSYYVAPPLMSNYAPIFLPTPIVTYQAVPVVPAPAMGTYYPLPTAAAAPAPAMGVYYPPPTVVPAPAPGRVRETWNLHPYRDRYRYQVKLPNGQEY